MLIVFQQLHLHQRSRVAHRQRAENNRVQHLIDRRIGADTERQCNHGGAGEGRISAELADRVSQVLSQRIEKREAAPGSVGHQQEYGAGYWVSQQDRSAEGGWR
jgi:hypothetical protein